MTTFGHATERQRLSELASYGIMDTAPEANFDRITELAAMIAGTPIALISLVDEKRQWFKAKVGIDICETRRSVAFCEHTIMQQAPLQVSDARQHPLFKDNPLVVDEPFIRFYYGVPLRTSRGYNLGSLCVIDRTSHQLSTKQKTCLNHLAELTVLMLEDRRALLQIGDRRRAL
ncbi:GAF domain-containing protein [Methylohalomonas lacus]|uniref:GAF domain-containing protein n=1 Tax=Methylohalomonas lacus TaxID=398773 RepID=A0AAE3HNN3_9GAMM|nr:GAF domain-containing protein [Methylohalomonas lacus]MCS3903823.1 GAF domain-containing protein [Methylohalomonas lacus]